MWMKSGRRVVQHALTFALFMLTACGQQQSSSLTTDSEETGQQIGDVMASIDEMGGSSGTISWNEADAARAFFARRAPWELRAPWEPLASWELIPEAMAASCSSSNTFSSCTGGLVVTRTFGGCTVGSATFNGTVTLLWSVNNGCTLSAVGDAIQRSPNFTVTGRRNATLTVSKSGTLGQRLSWVSGTGASKVMSFFSDGIRRTFTSGTGTTLLDFTTTTTSNLTVTGTSRSGRVISGGVLRVTNNSSGITCDYTPSAVTWSTTCNCPVSGSWTGTCSDGKSTSLSITGCGTASLTISGASDTVTFDRCAGV